jgi:gluconolactonase
MLSCEHATSRVTRTDLDGKITVLVTHYKDKTLNSPNDIIVKSDGRIYFTDPTYGRTADFGLLREPELDFRGVYRMDEDGGNLTLLADDFIQPNGLCFSRDERRLFVNDTERGHIRVFDVDAKGLLTSGNILAQLTGTGDGGPDGMKVDRDNNLYCCGPGGLHVLTADGHSLGVIKTPEALANFTWGDVDMQSIFLTASTSLYRVRTRTPGVRLF